MASMDVFRLSLLSVEPRTTRLTFVAEQASSAGMKLLRLRRRGGVEKGRRIKLFLRHPSLSSLVLISCKIEIYGGEESWGRNRGGAAWLWEIKNVRCSFPFFFFFSFARFILLSWKIIEGVDEDKGNEDGWEVFVRLCVV